MVYLPPAFTETRREALVAHIERHDFGMLVTHGAAGLIASQIPFLVDERDGGLVLQCHLARANPQLADLEGAAEALAVFAGPHAYISPSWYEAVPAVPTWNYATVHAYGPARRIEDAGWLRELVRRLSERHEAGEAAQRRLPWRMDDLPEPYVQSMLNGIVGIEIAVARIEGKFKLSQNRPAGDRPRIIAALERRADADSHAVADLMRQRE
jgi:transcriptional regulator